MKSRRTLLVAALAAAAAWSWMAATVQFNYGGNWTALFITGDKFDLPEQIAPGTFVFHASSGYDGQFYRIVAHDPLMTTTMWMVMDDPALRYRRILVPAVAYLVSMGHDDFVDAAYLAVTLLNIFLGAWFTALLAAGEGRSPWWGLAFVFLPGVLITADRMTVDAAQYACMAGAFWAWRRQNWNACWLWAALAALSRDLGGLALLSIAAVCIVKRDWLRAAWMAASGIPAAAWYFWLHGTIASRITPDLPPLSGAVPRWAGFEPGYGLLLRIIDPVHHGLPPLLETATRNLDRLALAAIGVAVVLAVVEARGRWADARAWIGLLSVAVFFAFTASAFWKDPYSYPRAFTPLLAVVAWRGAERGRWWYFAPLALSTLRVLWQMGPQALGILGLRA
jgi:hypothetical protein